MAAMLMRVFGALVCILVANSNVMPPRDFKLQAIAGKWYLIGLATNAQWFITRKTDMKMGMALLVPTAGGDLGMTFSSLKSDGSCWMTTHLAKKTDVPGKFTFRSQRWGNDNDVRVADVKYDEYALVHSIKTKGGVPSTLNMLYARGTDLNPEVQHKFKQFSLETGILPENIAILPKNDVCPAA